MARRCAFTVDVDWAPTAMIRYALDAFERRGIRTTLFATHPLPVDLVGDHEIALHPKIECAGPCSSNLEELKEQFPLARGARCHGLRHDYGLLAAYEKLGLTYDSNYFMHNQPGIEPFRLGRSVWELPVFFMDYIYLDPLGPSSTPTFAVEDLTWEHEGMMVFDFHPQHIYLNSRDLDKYGPAKTSMQDTASLQQFRTPRGPRGGIADLLEETLDFVLASGIPVVTMSELLPEGAS